MAVDNATCLELGYSNKGAVADNHHAGSMHPEHDPTVGRLPHDPARALELMKEGAEDYEHELISSTMTGVKTQLTRLLRSCVTQASRSSVHPTVQHSGTIGRNIHSAQQTGTVHSRHRFGVLHTVQAKHGTNLVGQTRTTRYWQKRTQSRTQTHVAKL